MDITPANQSDSAKFSEIEFENMNPLFAESPDWNIATVEAMVRENLQRAWKLSGDELLGFYYWISDEDCSVLLRPQRRTIPVELKIRESTGPGATRRNFVRRT